MDTIESPFLSLKLSDSYSEIREAVRDLCSHYPDEYRRKVDDERGFPEEFVNALTSAGCWLAGCHDSRGIRRLRPWPD